jgi:hypothetical protein
MIRKENLILTYASGQEMLNSPEFWVFIKSFERNVPDADLVVLTHDMPEDVEAKILHNCRSQVRRIPAADMHYLYRDRHLSFWNYLNEHGHKYGLVLSTDSRDVVFQANPFDWVVEWRARHDTIHGDKGFLDHFVVLMSEGFKMAQSGFALVDHFEFQRDVPRPYLREDRDRWVVNGGVFLGTPRAMQDWHFLIWVTTMKTIGRCTDQATVNWLMHYLENDDTYQISFPQHDHLCLTGEGVKEGVVEPLLKDGFLLNSKNQVYKMVHQWDRLDLLKEQVLAQYSS